MPVSKLTPAQDAFLRRCDTRNVAARITDNLLWSVGVASVEDLTDKQCEKFIKEITTHPDWWGTAGK